MSCAFCRIVNREHQAAIVHEDEQTFAFLDNRPLFGGHTLLIPKNHIELITELPASMLAPFFATLQRLVRAVETATGAEGTFVANNNRVSQSVPHLHFHIVPRRKGDGLKGFFWPRTKYSSDAEMEETAARIRKALTNL